MDKNEILQNLSSIRKKFIITINSLPEEKILTPGIVGDWSVKDILAHITMWEAELVTLLWQAERGRNPTTAHFGKTSIDELNNKWYLSMKNRALSQILSDFHGVRKQTERRVMALTNNDLTNPKRFTWLAEKPLWVWIANDSYDHEKEHHENILAWISDKAN